jgi:hypothetical protein
MQLVPPGREPTPWAIQQQPKRSPHLFPLGFVGSEIVKNDHRVDRPAVGLNDPIEIASTSDVFAVVKDGRPDLPVEKCDASGRVSQA